MRVIRRDKNIAVRLSRNVRTIGRTVGLGLFGEITIVNAHNPNNSNNQTLKCEGKMNQFLRRGRTGVHMHQWGRTL
jgi:hypothetical protein